MYIATETLWQCICCHLPSGSISEDSLHASHEHLKTLYHGDHLDHGELLFRRVVITRCLKQTFILILD